MQTKLIAVVGPTGAGKSDLGLSIVEQIVAAGGKAEIVNSDSMQFYRGMDIGTAKPSAQELAAVPHHLIDLIDPLESYSAARFVSDTRRLMTEIRARGRVPLLVGGTMLYIKALVDGLDDIPSAAPEVRALLDQRALQEGWPALHAELARLDPEVRLCRKRQ